MKYILDCGTALSQSPEEINLKCEIYEKYEAFGIIHGYFHSEYLRFGLGSQQLGQGQIVLLGSSSKITRSEQT